MSHHLPPHCTKLFCLRANGNGSGKHLHGQTAISFSATLLYGSDGSLVLAKRLLVVHGQRLGKAGLVNRKTATQSITRPPVLSWCGHQRGASPLTRPPNIATTQPSQSPTPHCHTATLPPPPNPPHRTATPATIRIDMPHRALHRFDAALRCTADRRDVLLLLLSIEATECADRPPACSVINK